MAGLSGVLGGAAAGVLGGILGAKTERDALKEQKAAREAMEARLNLSVEEVEGVVDDYMQGLDQVAATFDPYDMEEAFNSFYEGVVVPMQRDFEQHMLPSVEAAYSGGVYGPDTFQSGAAKEATLRAKQSLSEKKGTLRAKEREGAISRNFAIKADKQEVLGKKMEARTLAPSMRAGNAQSIYKAQSEGVAAKLASGQSRVDTILGIPSAMVSGMKLEDMIRDSNKTSETPKK